MDKTGNYISVPITDIGEISNLKLTITEVSIDYGRCYTLNIRWQMKHKDYFTLFFNLSIPQKMVIFIHEEFNEMGLNYGFWPTKPVSFTIKRGEVINAVFKRRFHIYKYMNENLECSKEKTYSYPKCALNWARESYKNLWNGSQTGKLAFINWQCC